jgi:hypothetical protein
MANVTFIIGNGFDLQMKVETSYTDFYNVYAQPQVGDNGLICWFKSVILKDKENEWENWADFELGMGEQSVLFKGENRATDFMSCYDDFVVEFNEYLNNKCLEIDWDRITDATISEFSLSLLRFIDKINMSQRSLLEKLLKCNPGQGGTLNFLQFNYTNLFDTLLLKSNKYIISQLSANPSVIETTYGIKRLGSNLHMHGSLGKYPIIGVNGAEQIQNERIRNDLRVQKIFVKQNYLSFLQNRQVNDPIPASSAISIIKNSDVICTFGTSIGDTDKYWWKLVGDWLKTEGKYLVIFDKCKGNDDGISPLSSLSREINLAEKKFNILVNLTKLAEFSDAELKNITPRVFVELDTKMFNITLPRRKLMTIPPKKETPAALAQV